jgi:hypothetical protein
MNTGLVESWNGNPVETGPLYPFVGWEIPLFLLCFALWVGYTIWQMAFERRVYRMEEENLAEGDNLDRTLKSDPEPS